MAERYPVSVDLLYPRNFNLLADSFVNTEDSISITLSEEGVAKTVSFATQDGEPYHAKVETFNTVEEKNESTSLANLISLYRVAEAKDPHNRLTRILNGVVLREVKAIRIDLTRQLESAELLENRIKNTDGRYEISSGHP